MIAGFSAKKRINVVSSPSAGPPAAMIDSLSFAPIDIGPPVLLRPTPTDESFGTGVTENSKAADFFATNAGPSTSKPFDRFLYFLPGSMNSRCSKSSLMPALIPLIDPLRTFCRMIWLASS